MAMKDQPIQQGVVQRLSRRVQRLTAGNAGPMTGPGTNTYLVGERELVVVDPGPALPEHIDALLAACGDRLRWILVTHTHTDHSPAAQLLARATGAQLLGQTIADDGFQDTAFVPDRELTDGDRLEGADFTLRAIHTPGHVGNHFCLLLEEEGLLLTGDHIMQGSTVVIIPPGGDMQAYIASLQCLLEHPVQVLAPGHGQLIFDPEREIRHLVAHRLQREARVADALQELGEASLDELVPRVYAEVDPSLHPVARYSLWAHLIKLEREGIAAERKGRWHWSGQRLV